MSDDTNDATGTAAAVEARPSWRSRRPRQTGAPAGGGAVYGLGMIGALVYFFASAQSGRDYVLAIPKASVWPALLVYNWLKSVYG
jgi:hypothetical protein